MRVMINVKGQSPGINAAVRKAIDRLLPLAFSSTRPYTFPTYVRLDTSFDKRIGELVTLAQSETVEGRAEWTEKAGEIIPCLVTDMPNRNLEQEDAFMKKYPSRYFLDEDLPYFFRHSIGNGFDSGYATIGGFAGVRSRALHGMGTPSVATKRRT